MKKFILLVIAYILFVPFMANAEEKYTITYDANDGTGRTQVVELTNDKIIMPDITFFEVEDLGDTDYLDKPVINSWNLNNNAKLSDYSDTRFYSNYTYTIDDLFDNSKNITLYAEWQKRISISPDDIYINEVYSGGKLYNGRVISCDIEPKKDFNIKFSNFHRRSGQQFLYYKLPECFTDSLTNNLNNELSVPLSLKEKINYLGTIMTYEGGFFYIKNNILFINFVDDGTTEYDKMNGITSVPFSIQYSFKFKQVTYNNRLLAVATVSSELNNQPTWQSNDIYPTGKIKTHYIDIDTNEEIKDSIEEEEIIGTKYSKKFVEIKDYTFVENTNDDIEFEEEQQTVYYKYRKAKSNKPMILENPKTGNKSLIIIITTTIVLSTITLIYKKKRI